MLASVLAFLGLGLFAAAAGLWLFSRAVTLRIDRRWPLRGQMLRLGGLDIAVADLPAGCDAPVLLLIHGASGNLHDPLLALQPALAGEFRLVAIDRPGHGHSERGPRHMSDPSRQADLAAEALDRLGIGSCLVFGHSWGAAVAAALALRHPQRVAGLVFVAPATHPWPGGVSRRTRLGAMPYVGRIFAALFVVPAGLFLVRSVVGAIFAPEAAPQDYAWRIGAQLAIRPKTFVANCRDVVDLYGHVLRLSARYGEIRAPTEIVTADGDPIVSPAIHAYGLARDIPGARLTILEGAGHMPHWTRPQEVAAAIRRVRDLAERRVGLAAE